MLLNILLKNKYFVKPPLIELNGYEYYFDQCKSYSHYNYIKPGLSSYIKSQHFEACLKICKEYFNDYNVIDFGCADGPFLPSLSKYFNQVLAIDLDPIRINFASILCKKLNLKNVDLICNKEMNLDELKLNMFLDYHILFLLETLEHVGNNEDLYGSKISFIEELFKLIGKKGIIIISVPKMIGISFFIQRIGFKIIRAHMDPISTKDFINASFFNNTDDLEKRWNGGHLGFNHLKLEKQLNKNFNVLEKRSLLFNVVYLIKQK